MEVKGYWTAYSYYGWVGDKFMRFTSEKEYLEYIRERGK